jgi:hypothetical protein
MGSAALFLGVVLVALAGPRVGAEPAALPGSAEPAGLAGVYEFQGMGADGRPYRGAVVIEPDGDRFLLQWFISRELSAVGLGIREGNMLAVSFFSADAGGVILYRIDGQRLVGHWSAPLTNGQVFEETLTRMADPPPAVVPSPPSTSPSPSRPKPSNSRPFGSSRPVRWVVPDAVPDSSR